MAAHTAFPDDVGALPQLLQSAATIASPDTSSPPLLDHSRRTAGAVLWSSTATVTTSSLISNRMTGTLSVCLRTFSTNTVTASFAVKIGSGRCQSIS